MRRVVITGAPPVQILDVAGPLEAFSSVPGYQVAIGCPPGESLLRSHRGVALTNARPLRELDGPIDTLVIAGGPGSESGVYDEPFVAWVREAASRSRRVASICTGAFLLAAAGLLDGRQAVTHWNFCDRLARDFPAVQVRPDPIYLRDGSIYTSAGITAGIDLSLALIEEDQAIRLPWLSPVSSSCSWCAPADRRSTATCSPTRPSLQSLSASCRSGCSSISRTI